MALEKYDACNTELADFVSEADCLEELGRIVAGFLFKVGFDIESITDQTTLDQAITDGDVKILKGLAGNWAKPTANKKPAKAFKVDQFSSWNYSIPISHYSVDANLPFWNDVVLSANDWSMAFIFEDLRTWAPLDDELSGIPLDFDMGPASQDEVGGSIQFEGTINWRTRFMPYVLELDKALLRTNFKE
ncbi:MAG: hypothetical protein AAF843_10310 [Bacteroidota bacterium]